MGHDNYWTKEMEGKEKGRSSLPFLQKVSLSHPNNKLSIFSFDQIYIQDIINICGT
jgi:hypothetical protein